VKLLIYWLLTGIAIATLLIGFRSMTYPVSATALGIIGWTVTPYLYLALILKLATKKMLIITVSILAVSLGVFGLWAFIKAMFFDNDAQSSLVFIVIPLWQWLILLIISLPAYFLTRAKVHN